MAKSRYGAVEFEPVAAGELSRIHEELHEYLDHLQEQVYSAAGLPPSVFLTEKERRERRERWQREPQNDWNW